MRAGRTSCRFWLHSFGCDVRDVNFRTLAGVDSFSTSRNRRCAQFAPKENKCFCLLCDRFWVGPFCWPPLQQVEHTQSFHSGSAAVRVCAP